MRRIHRFAAQREISLRFRNRDGDSDGDGQRNETHHLGTLLGRSRAIMTRRCRSGDEENESEAASSESRALIRCIGWEENYGGRGNGRRESKSFDSIRRGTLLDQIVLPGSPRRSKVCLRPNQ